MDNCPICKQPLTIHGYYDRKLTHSTLINRKCVIIYRQRRYYCKYCEQTFHENNPFINTSEHISLETKINVLKDLKFVSNTYSSVAKRYSISATKVMSIFDKHVQISRKKLPEVLSIDEHYFPDSSYDSLYICILMDFNDGTLIDVLPDRKKEYLISYFNKIKNNDIKKHTDELKCVKYVSIDLYDTYKQIAQSYLPNALICEDSFHLIEHLTIAFRNVRLRCRRNTQDENMIYLISKFRYIFNHGIDLDNKAKYNKRFKRYMNYRDIVEILFMRFPDLEKAYNLKEKYISFNENIKGNKEEELADLIHEFGESNIKEYDEFYNLLINWKCEIVNSFIIYNNRS